MQPRSCEDIRLLISKYIDREATRDEREIVDLHVAVCAECASKLTEYMEFAAIFAEAPVRAPQPDLRAGVFREIGTVKEDARSKESGQVQRRLWHRLMAAVARGSAGHSDNGGAGARLWNAFSPFAAVSLAVVALIAVVMVNGPKGEAPRTVEDVAVIYPSVPTIPATVVYPAFLSTGSLGSDGNVPPAMGTKLANVQPLASASVIVEATSTVGGDMLLSLQQASTIMENGTAWHQLRDPEFGYSISYPSNWWTQAQGNSRLFFPWSLGGTKYAPYWIELRVESNPQHLDALHASSILLGGKGTLEGGGTAALWLRYSTGDDANVSDEIYAFDANSMYILRLNVPRTSELAQFPQRWAEAENVFSKMSRKVSLGAGQGKALFLNGGDLYAVGTGSSSGSSDIQPVWRGYGAKWTRQFAISPDGRGVALSTTGNADDLWATDLSLAQMDASSEITPQPLMSDAEIHDVAWYSDRDLLAIATTKGSGLGIYRITVPAGQAASAPELLVKLGDDMAGARGIAVSPDRQIISFLAPLGANIGTDLYAVRPDGSNLTRIISHADGVPPALPNGATVAATNQAVKSYVWTDGRLEPGAGGYSFHMLYTCGNAESPTFYRGGFLYGAPGGSHGPLLDPAWLHVSDATSVQIVHLTYSSAAGKVAFSGFYNLKGFKVETLAGLWTADLVNGSLANVKSLPLPGGSHGATDLQWSPDGNSLIYRETVPSSEASFASRYDGHSPFSIVKFDTTTGTKTVLYNAMGR